MESSRRANINAFIAASIWGILLLAIDRTLEFGANKAISEALPYRSIFLSVLGWGSTLVSLLAYPLLAAILLHRKASIWRNVFMFSAIGSCLGTIGLFTLTYITTISIGNAVMLVILVILLIGQFRFALLRMEKSFEFQTERETPYWETLDNLPLINFLFLRFPSPDNSAS